MQKYKNFREKDRRKPLRSRPMTSILMDSKSMIYKRKKMMNELK